MIFKSKLKQPLNFIVCGTQKGGTTALDYYLRSHQEICMAIKKEVHFFDNDNYFKHEKIVAPLKKSNFEFKFNAL